MKWTDQELLEQFEKCSENVEGKFRLSLPGLNKLLRDPKCPDTRSSNIAEYLSTIKQKIEANKKLYKS